MIAERSEAGCGGKAEGRPGAIEPSAHRTFQPHDLESVRLVLRERAAMIASAALTGALCAALYSFSREPVYEAEALVEVSLPQTRRIASLSDPLHGELTLQQHRMTSSRVLGAVATSVDLAARVGVAGAGAEWLAARVSVERVPDTGTLRIRTRAAHPRLAADLANATAMIWEREDLETRVSARKKRLAWLSEQMTEMKEQVERSELELIRYVEQADLALAELPAGVDGGAADDSDPMVPGGALLGRLEREVSQKEIEIELNRLHRTDEHPAVQRLAQELALLRKKYGSERQRLTELQKKRVRYGILARDAELNQHLFHLLMKELKEANLLADDEGHVAVIEPASAPSTPIAPRPARDVSTGAAAGLLLGIGFAFLRETLDRRIKSREEVKAIFGDALLGVVHHAGDTKPPAPGAVEHDSSMEEFRILRANIALSSPPNGGRALLVTSGVPGEGKTWVATRLAIAMASAGQRVLLVEGDLRRPTLGRVLDLRATIGLSQLVADPELAAESAVQASPWPSLSVCLAGPRTGNPAELLQSKRLAELLDHWRQRFDRVILDSPPLDALADAVMMARVVDAVLMVVGVGTATPQSTDSALRQIARTRATLLGAVANRLATRDDAYYSGYYTTGPQ